MSKPDDVPQEVWVKAHEVLDGYLYSGLSPDEAVARAIMAAKAEAYEEAAKVAEGMRHGHLDLLAQEVARARAEEIAAAIRKLAE